MGGVIKESSNGSSPLTLEEKKPPTNRLISLLHRLHAENVFDTPTHCQNFLRNLTYPEFERWISVVNGVAREAKQENRGVHSGRVIITDSKDSLPPSLDYLSPYKENKSELLQDIFNTAQGLDDIEHAATLLAVGINIIHPFRDGNGRTSRLVYSLLALGYDGSSSADAYYSQLLKNTEGRSFADLNQDHGELRKRYSQFATNSIISSASLPSENFQVEPITGDLSQIGVNIDVIDHAYELKDILNEPYFNIPIILEWISSSYTSLNQCATDPSNPRVISAEKVLLEFVEDDVLIIISLWSNLKRNYLKTLIDCFKTGDSPIYGSAEGIVASYRNQQQDKLAQIVEGASWGAGRRHSNN